MASRYEVEVTVSSAKDLKNVNWRYGPIRPYAIVWTNPDRKITTRTSDDGDTSPEWNQKLAVPLDRAIEEATLYVDVVHYAAPEEDDTKPLIGSTKISLSDIVDDEGIGSRATRTLKFKRPSGRPQGKLELEIVIRDLRYHGERPFPPPQSVGYGAPPPAGGYAAPSYAAPHRSAYSYNEPAPTYGAPAPYGNPGYGHAPAYGEPAPYGNPGYGGQPPSYGAPAPQGYPAYGQPAAVAQPEEEKKKSKFGGAGMGTGLAVGAAAGLAGGLAIGYGIHKMRGDDDDDEDQDEDEDKDDVDEKDDDDDDDDKDDKDEKDASSCDDEDDD